MMTLGSLFDGLGGWQIAACRAGIKPVWSSEIEKFPLKLTSIRFPNTKQIGDITKLSAAEIKPVDIITMGSPCQDLSIAGKREGLAGERSGLFVTAINLVHAMRKLTNGRYPKYVVWENVTGAFSSNKGMDFKTVLEKITSGLGKTKDDYISACEKGFILSVDNAHALHPSFPEKMDVKERVYMGKGIVVKHHVNYATDGESSAIFKTILDKANVERQDYYNNSDQRCGSTIGLMASANLGMKACDIGLAQLAMHSAVETVSYADISKMQAGVKAFFDTRLVESSSSILVG